MTSAQKKSARTQLSPATTSALILGCPVALAFEIFGDRWSWLILREQFLGYRRFEDLRRRTGAARGTLTARLNGLIDAGVLYRNRYQTNPIRHEYRLTDKGLDLYPVALMVWAWERRWSDEHDRLPAELTHKACGQSTHPEIRCRSCKEPINATDVNYYPGPGIEPRKIGLASGRRRRQPKAAQPKGVDQSFFHAVDIIGDRWAGLVLAAMWFRLHRYDDIASAIGIATNILADRLKRLTATGVLERRPYSAKPERYEYRLTAKGRDLYGLTLTLHQWSDQWLQGSKGPALILNHHCGAPLEGSVCCNACEKPLTLGEVSYGVGGPAAAG